MLGSCVYSAEVTGGKVILQPQRDITAACEVLARFGFDLIESCLLVSAGTDIDYQPFVLLYSLHVHVHLCM